MTKKIIIATASLTLAAAFALTAFAEATTTPASPADIATKITCVGAAVATREQAIDTAMTSYTASTNSAYSARATALGQAYSQTTLMTVRSAVKKAWSDFTMTMKTARKTWQSTRMSAWSQYKTSTAVCKAPAGTGDGANSSSEVTGQ